MLVFILCYLYRLKRLFNVSLNLLEVSAAWTLINFLTELFSNPRLYINYKNQIENKEGKQ